jgi:drug/metabolite transporter (DMT)-like permease
MWGSSFLLIEIGLDHFRPTAVTLLRLMFGAATLAVIPAARKPIPRSDLPATALLGLVWMAVPLLLFPIAQQEIDSSLAGMLNGAVPLFSAAVGALIYRRLPGSRQLVGLFIGFLGVVVISWPAVQGAHATAFGVGLAVLATLLYGIAFNIAVPLEQRNGALPVIWRAQLFALVLVAPVGVVGVAQSTFSWTSLLAVAALGCFGTALAFVAFTTLMGRVGAARGAVTIYFLPIVAIVLGVVFRDETLAAASLVGTALVTVGAYLTSRRERATRI